MARKHGKNNAKLKALKTKRERSQKQELMKRIAKSEPVKQTELRDKPTLAAFDEWKSGTPVKNLVAALKTSEFTLRQRFINIAGGREAFDALRKSGAGGRVFGGKKPTPRTRETVVMDDAKVMRIKSEDIRAVKSSATVAHCIEVLRNIDAQIERAKSSMERTLLRASKENAEAVVAASKRDAKHKGWTSLNVAATDGYELRLVRADGQQFVRANAMERADIIVVSESGDTRWRSAETASRVKAARQQDKLVERGEAARKVKKQDQTEFAGVLKKAKSKSKTQKHSAKKRRLTLS